MSLSWPAVPGTAVNMSLGTIAAVGTGSFTIVALTSPAGANHALVGMKVSSSYDLQIITDTNVFYGGGDFSGFGTSVNNDWQIIGQSKASGSNVYRWHFWNYTANSAKTHTDGTGTHANPGAITAIEIGNGDNRGNGLIAAIAVWKRALSDAEFDSLCTSNLSDWMAVTGGQPDAIWAMNVAAASVVDGTGNGANASSVTGTVSAGADPPGFSYTLSAAAPPSSPGRLPPPYLIGPLVAARAAMFHEPAATAVAASGAGIATTHPSTGATGQKTGSGVGTALTHPVTTTAGQKAGSGPAAPQVRPATGTTGQKATTGAGTAVAHPAVTETGRKIGTGAAGTATRAAVTATGFKVATGTAAPLAHPGTVAAGSKTGTGTAAALAHQSTLAVSGHLGAAAVSARAVVAATGFKVATGVAGPAARAATTATGQHRGSGAATAYAHPSSTATGRKAATGVAGAQTHPAVVSVGVKTTSGAARVVGHVMTVVLAGVAEPAGVAHLTHVTPGPLAHVRQSPLVHVGGG